jgi:phenylalanine ammonia-lyase
LIRELHSGVLQAPARFRPWHETNHRHDGDTGSDFNNRIRDVNSQASSDTSKKLVSQNDCTVADHDGTNKRLEDVASLLENALPADDPNTCMPESWTRASIIIRINSLASAYSGVRPILITSMMDLLKHNIIPRIPLRGSISASGDLMPLSYVAGTLLGKPTLTVSATDSNTGARRVTTADVALAESSLKPLRLGPKEGLAIVNGTAVSTGVGALAIHEAHGLAVLSQVLTAMSVEALLGTSESFHPFFAKVRPHPGQIETSHNIYHFLAGSQLIQSPDGSEEGSLRQDRYSIRTASQWLGPVLEDLLLAHQQVTIECNSVTDNPLIDDSRMLHGGNFQAKSVTSAMEKTRLGLQSIGRMLFTQCTELLNPKTNRGLPPNLVADEPSSSWIMKPLDIMVAALQSELGFLANPVGTHVQTAEMGNQALNSLALISARYCHVALDVLSQLAVGHLFALCQALDLRAMQYQFLEAFRPELQSATEEIIGPILHPQQSIEKLHAAIWAQLDRYLEQAVTMDTEQRFTRVVTTLEPVVLRFIDPTANSSIPTLRGWTEHCSHLMLQTFQNTRDHYSAHPDASFLLGSASRRVYNFVRGRLAVPFIRAYNLRSPDPEPADGYGDVPYPQGRNVNKDSMTTGSYITILYEAIRNGSLYVPIMECLREAQETRDSNQTFKASSPGEVVDSLVVKARL